MKIEIYKGGDSLFYYQLKAGNGQILAESRTGFVLEKDCYRAACNLINDIKKKTVDIVSKSKRFFKQVQ